VSFLSSVRSSFLESDFGDDFEEGQSTICLLRKSFPGVVACHPARFGASLIRSEVADGHPIVRLQRSSFEMRWTVPVPIPSDFATFKITYSLRKLLSHLPFGRAVYLRPAELHALGKGAFEARLHALSHHAAFEFRKGAGYLENQLAHRGRRTDPAEIHRHNFLSFGILSGSYLNRAVDSFVPFPLTRIVNVLSRPSSLFLFSSVRMSSFNLNRKTDTDDDGSIEVGDKRQSRESFLSIARVKTVSSQVTITLEMVRSVEQFLTSM
jgi:hypothetical protein